MQQIINTFFTFVVKQRNLVMRAFQIVSWGLVIFFVFAIWSTITRDSSAFSIYRLSKEFGEYAVLCFILTSIPGIARRFRYNQKLIMVLMMFRRQIGIITYLFVIIHSMVLRIIPWTMREYPVFPMESTIVFGVLSNITLFLLFITSNDWSVKVMGNWWGKVHDLMYIVVWGIFLHLAFVGVGKWTILIGATAIAQLASHMYASHHR